MQFYVYSNTNPASKGQYPYLLDVQNNLLADLKTRLVIPLTAQANCRSGVISKLCPVFNINGEPFVALTQQMAGIELRLLGAEVADLSAYRTEIIAAIDFAVVGI